MILSCKSCEKKFVVPDNAIGASGRLVQCSSCGNKWKQFPIKDSTDIKKKKSNVVRDLKNINKPIKAKKKKIIKKSGPDLYSPEYLAKKHGIKIHDISNLPKTNKIKTKSNQNFGFYNFLIIFIILTITLLKLVHFAENTIVNYFPFLELYLDYLFESITNLKDIIQSLFSNY
tara:strand:- start:227 stop:745 length:519 start_codon:yes stop_codon:yes gene_type:complete